MHLTTKITISAFMSYVIHGCGEETRFNILQLDFTDFEMK